MLILVTQLCPTLCNPMDCSPLGFFVYKILQARILEWIAGKPSVSLSLSLSPFLSFPPSSPLFSPSLRPTSSFGAAAKRETQGWAPSPTSVFTKEPRIPLLGEKERAHVFFSFFQVEAIPVARSAERYPLCLTPPEPTKLSLLLQGLRRFLGLPCGC